MADVVRNHRLFQFNVVIIGSSRAENFSAVSQIKAVNLTAADFK